ncbi:hypothetical protein FBR03_10075 [Betaproteobacteria bacterium PRO1]|nr:hypothetical protein [Betaproteobacteria bacterium PRO1]
MAGKISTSQFASQVGVTGSAIRKAIAAGRLTADADGLLDPVAALAQWQHNRRRRRRPRGADPAVEGAPPPAGGGFWQHRTEREAAEAAIARMREREMAGELVRRAEVERELAGRIIALREHLNTMADRLSAVVAAESDQAACRRAIADEVRQALRGFAAELEVAKSSTTNPLP